ncbi:MAG: class I SAM-dependent methyltransferase [Myxococcota bacterium]|nr:class I SAM-dependent methyltransferase [Myxococcota bacterium]
MAGLVDEIAEMLALPRGLQLERAQAIRDRHAADAHPEEWNTRFGPDSLFSAWTDCPLMRPLYASNRALITAHLADRSDWRAVEIGGGDGRLWDQLPIETPGTLVVVDPVAEVHAQVAARLPSNIRLESFVGLAQDFQGWDEVDLFVCSLTLHHVAGLSAPHRETHGLAGEGKLEILERAAAALAARQGLGILNEADVYCEIDLAPGHPQLLDHLLDSYLRRCGKALVDAVQRQPDHPLAPRWATILHRWCLDQLAVGELPLEQRDVYELSVERWVALLESAGLKVTSLAFTDPYRLFCQYQLRA